uniref:Uncharacterized protein n=1 Tax=Timema cristinae TaxID=61476 RepID=A0A7R9CJU5_TIMCR|nr:unnamed protein product [Timema cristinae]
MESLYHQTNQLIQETQQYFERLESSRGNNCELIEREIQTRIDTITRNCDRLDMLVHKEPPSRRTTSKMRVDQLKYDNIHLQAEERELLLNSQFTTNNSHLEGDTSILMDHSLQHNSALQISKGPGFNPWCAQNFSVKQWIRNGVKLGQISSSSSLENLA